MVHKQKRILLAAFITLFLCFDIFTVASAQQRHFSATQSGIHTEKSAITPELRQLIKDLQLNGTIPGISIAVVHSGGKVEMEGFGASSEDGDKVSTETLFGLASCSKAFLTGSVGILMEDFAHGRNVTPLPNGAKTFDWHTKVKDLLPNDWKLMDHWASEKATFRDILSHVSGLSRHGIAYQPSDSPVDLIHRMRYLRPSFELREKFQYNNQMYMLATHVMSLYSGKPYLDFVKERIFTPLGMSSSTFSESEASKDGRLTHTFNKEGRRIPFWISDSNKTLFAGPGGVISSAHDMARWVQMLVNGGVDPLTNATILPKPVFDAVTSAQSIPYPKGMFPEFSFIGYGLGWDRQSYLGHEILKHDGGIPGVSTEVGFLPNDRIGIVVLCNASMKASQAVAIFYRIMEDLLGLPRIASTRYASAKQLGTSSESAPHPTTKSATAMNKVSANEEGLPLEKYAGTYTNLAYPNMTVCAPAASKLSRSCKTMIEDFSRVEDISASNSTLYLGITSLWLPNARLRRIGQDRFEVAVTHLFPDGYGKDTSPFELSELGEYAAEVQFVVEDGEMTGFGLTYPTDESTLRQRKGGSVQETADVWFEKV